MHRFALMVGFVVAFSLFVGATCSKSVPESKKDAAVEDASTEDASAKDIIVIMDDAAAVVEDAAQ